MYKKPACCRQAAGVKMKNPKRKFTAEFNVQVLREHLENQIAVGKICEQYNIQPNLFYL